MPDPPTTEWSLASHADLVISIIWILLLYKTANIVVLVKR
jgi:hypothetical protein